MNQPLPTIISAAVLRSLAAPGETHAIRLILLNTAGATIATLRGNKRKYLLQRDGKLRRHILDIPASLWAQEMPTENYRDNKSIAHDLQSRPSVLAPFITMIVPWEGAAATAGTAEEPAKVGAPDADVAAVMLSYLRHIKAPEHVMEMAQGIAASPQDFLHFMEEPDQVPPENLKAEITPEPAKSETPAAKRMREKRARDKAAKAEAAKNLQPA